MWLADDRESKTIRMQIQPSEGGQHQSSTTDTASADTALSREYSLQPRVLSDQIEDCPPIHQHDRPQFLDSRIVCIP